MDQTRTSRYPVVLQYPDDPLMDVLIAFLEFGEAYEQWLVDKEAHSMELKT